MKNCENSHSEPASEILLPNEPKTHDFRAQSRFHPQPDGTVKVDMPDVKYIDQKDTVIIDPIL